MTKVSYAQTVYGQEEIDAVVSCLKHSTQMGEKSSIFEKNIAKLFAKKYGLFVNSGSAALYLGMEASSFSEGSEIITPALTFSTTVGCVVKNNLIPVFIDVGPSDYCINTDQIESMITEKTRAILAPNLMGNLCNWPEIRRIADKYNLLGFTSRKSGDLNAAAEYYKKALEINPKHIQALEYQGELYLQLGEIEQAKKNLEKIKTICWFICKEKKMLEEAIKLALN